MNFYSIEQSFLFLFLNAQQVYLSVYLLRYFINSINAH